MVPEPAKMAVDEAIAALNADALRAPQTAVAEAEGDALAESSATLAAALIHAAATGPIPTMWRSRRLTRRS